MAVFIKIPFPQCRPGVYGPEPPRFGLVLTLGCALNNFSREMVTVFNTDVQYVGRVFHVQTEDRGLANPVIESLVYTGGEIITSRRTGYADLAQSPEHSDLELARRMEAQHQTIIREILSGRFDPDGPKPFG